MTTKVRVEGVAMNLTEGQKHITSIDTHAHTCAKRKKLGVFTDLTLSYRK